MDSLIIIAVIGGLMFLMAKFQNKESENIDLKVKLMKEKIKQTEKYKKYKKMDFYALYEFKQVLLYQCKKLKQTANINHQNIWKDESFIEKFAELHLINDLALSKFNSGIHNDDIYDFFVNLDS